MSAGPRDTFLSSCQTATLYLQKHPNYGITSSGNGGRPWGSPFKVIQDQRWRWHWMHHPGFPICWQYKYGSKPHRLGTARDDSLSSGRTTFWVSAQGHPRSKVKVALNSQPMVSYFLVLPTMGLGLTIWPQRTSVTDRQTDFQWHNFQWHRHNFIGQKWIY